MHIIEKKRDDSCHNSSYPIPVQNAGNCILESPILQISRGGGGMPPDPPRSSCLRASGANGARPPAEPLHPVLPNATENPDR